MDIKVYTSLPEEAKRIRETVFVKEQHFTDEFDETDAFSLHFACFDDNHIPVGCCRFFYSKEDNRYQIGRVAVLKEYRHHHIASLILKKVEEEAKKRGIKTLYLHSQIQVVGFYGKLGYQPFGNVEDEQGWPHQWMKKEIS